MYTISFRIKLTTLAGQNVYLNGSCLSNKCLNAGTKIVVVEKNATLPDDAEVIECQLTQRKADSFLWELA